MLHKWVLTSYIQNKLGNTSKLERVYYIDSSFRESLLAYAEEKVTTLQLGDPAPFAGTLFNTEATARMLAELELNEEACELRVNRAVELKEAELQLTIDQLQIRLDTSSEIFEGVAA